MKYLIGLTGNIGSGKSTVLAMLEQLGARIVDADDLVHEVMDRGTPVWQAIVDTFGEAVLDEEGRIDRQKLGSVVFEDPQALKRLVSNGVQLRPFSQAIMEACLKASNEVNAEESAKNANYKKVLESMQAFRNDEYLWWQVAEYSFDSFMIRSRTKG